MISAAKIVIFSIENNILCNFLSKNIPFVYRMIEKRLATFWLQAFWTGILLNYLLVYFCVIIYKYKENK